jgi:hypothetical protein
MKLYFAFLTIFRPERAPQKIHYIVQRDNVRVKNYSNPWTLASTSVPSGHVTGTDWHTTINAVLGTLDYRLFTSSWHWSILACALLSYHFLQLILLFPVYHQDCFMIKIGTCRVFQPQINTVFSLLLDYQITIIPYQTDGNFSGREISVIKTNDLQTAPSNHVLSTSVNLTEQIRT